jgi:heparan-alpha-glucosaminide N-acetyltransferase
MPPRARAQTVVKSDLLPYRVASIDAYRGAVILLMMTDVLAFADIARALPGHPVLDFLAYHLSHVPWAGCSLWDLIQPSFSFLVGVSLPFSLSRRMQAGQPRSYLTLHAAGRAFILILLGVILRRIDSLVSQLEDVRTTDIRLTFEDTLTQIGFGYFFLYLLALHSRWTQWTALAVILVGYWLAFALYPLPDAAFDWQGAVADRNWPFNLTGFAAHWNKNTNFASQFDTRVLHLRANPEGYATLNFIPTLGTMILGLLCGGILKTERSSAAKLRWLVVCGLACSAAGIALHVAGVSPIVKRIWTPSWVLFSGACCLLILAGFYLTMDVWHKIGWARCLIIVGMNSLAGYLIAWVVDLAESLSFPSVSPDTVYAQLLLGAAIICAEWLILWWMWRRKVFFRL